MYLVPDLSGFRFSHFIFSLLLSICCFIPSEKLMATTYYVSATGDDLAAGTSPATAWASIVRVNAATIMAGDVILFEGGSTFGGNLAFSGVECGTSTSPIRISSYGGGTATLDAGSSSHGILVYDCAGFEIVNLQIMGSGRATNNFSGIIFYTDVANPPLSRHTYIRIDSVEVSGFNKGGITIMADEDFTDKGYEDIQITNSEIHDCGDHGIEIVAKLLNGTTLYPCANVYINNCKAYDNPGEIGKINKHTGNGIVVGTTDGVIIEHCLAWNNGAENVTTTGGPVGIWLWDCKDGIIQHCESYNNHTGASSGKDGGGFDLDGGCNNCIIQYCYSHDNEGAGFLIAEFDDARDMVDNQIRYCISENDGRKNDYSAINVWRSSAPTAGILHNTSIYNNTIYISANTGTTPAAFKSISGGITNMQVANNIFIVSDGVRLVDKSHGASADINFTGNVYYSENGVYSYREGANNYNSLNNWRAGKGQEMQGGNPVGLETDPLLKNPGNGGTVGDPFLLSGLEAYKATTGSPLEDAGQDLNTLYGLNVGTRDFFGTTTPISLIHDIGAYEGMGEPLSANDISIHAKRISKNEVRLSWRRNIDLSPLKIEVQRKSGTSPFLTLESINGRETSFIDRHAISGGKYYYRIIFIYEDGRKDYSSTVEIASLGQWPQMEIFPNPARTNVQLQLYQTGTYVTRVEIMDLKGIRLYQQIHTTDADGKINFPLDKKMAAGIYLLRLYFEGSSFEQKLLVSP